MNETFTYRGFVKEYDWRVDPRIDALFLKFIDREEIDRCILNIEAKKVTEGYVYVI